jgi:hypothetical protein
VTNVSATTTERKSQAKDSLDLVSAYAAFFLLRPLGLGWASIKAAYSGSRALQLTGKAQLRWRKRRKYLDVDKVFEEFCLPKEIRVAFYGVGKLEKER